MQNRLYLSAVNGSQSAFLLSNIKTVRLQIHLSIGVVTRIRACNPRLILSIYALFFFFTPAATSDSQPDTMPAKQAGTKSTAGRGRASTSKTGAAASSSTGAGSKRARKGRPSAADRAEEVEEVGSDEGGGGADDHDEGGDDEEDQQKTIPPELLTRLLHEFFEKDGTRVTRDANAAVARYMDIFVREAIARSAAERDGKFMEVSLAGSSSLAGLEERSPRGLGLDGAGRNFPVFVSSLLSRPPAYLQRQTDRPLTLTMSQVEDLEKVAPQLLLDL